MEKIFKIDFNCTPYLIGYFPPFFIQSNNQLEALNKLTEIFKNKKVLINNINIEEICSLNQIIK